MLKYGKQKKRKRGDAEELLVRWFSRFIRVRDTDPRTGLCKCITCPRRWPPEKMHEGHFVKRNRVNIKFHEKNNNAQCPLCNCGEDGEQGRYAVELDRKWGAGTAEMLLNIASRTGGLDQVGMRLQADHYRRETNRLLKEKRLKKWW